MALGLGVCPPVMAQQTRAERTHYVETSHYDDVVDFVRHIRPRLELGTLGKTTEGRDIPYLIMSRVAKSPADAHARGIPVVYVQANIHAGEVEGKEALLALLRDLARERRANVLDSLLIIAVPIYNADGNEKFASQSVNRTEQNGPELVGSGRMGKGWISIGITLRPKPPRPGPRSRRSIGGIRTCSWICTRPMAASMGMR